MYVVSYQNSSDDCLELVKMPQLSNHWSSIFAPEDLSPQSPQSRETFFSSKERAEVDRGARRLKSPISPRHAADNRLHCWKGVSILDGRGRTKGTDGRMSESKQAPCEEEKGKMSIIGSKVFCCFWYMPHITLHPRVGTSQIILSSPPLVSKLLLLSESSISWQ